MNQVQQDFVGKIQQYVRSLLPAFIALDVEGREADLPLGTLRVVCEFPRSITVAAPPRPSIADTSITRWNAGEREPPTLRNLFGAAWIEPYITWSSDLAWRATADGKKAGLK